MNESKKACINGPCFFFYYFCCFPERVVFRTGAFPIFWSLWELPLQFIIKPMTAQKMVWASICFHLNISTSWGGWTLYSSNQGSDLFQNWPGLILPEKVLLYTVFVNVDPFSCHWDRQVKAKRNFVEISPSYSGIARFQYSLGFKGTV